MIYLDFFCLCFGQHRDLHVRTHSCPTRRSAVLAAARALRGAAAVGRGRPRTLADHLPLAFPAAMLVVFFVTPFGTMIAVSFFQRQQGGFYTVDFVFSN